MDSKKYNKIKLTVGVLKGITSFILILLFVALGYSKRLEELLNLYITNEYALLLTFTAAIGLTGAMIFLPVNYYLDYCLEHKYNLSNQSLGRWAFENLKALLLAAIVGIPLLLIFYYLLNLFGAFWWLPFAVVLFFFSVVLAQILPVIILPIFYKILPLQDEPLKLRIKSIAKSAGIKVQDIYTFDMSKNTKKANAAFTGLGNTKRIILADNFLEKYSYDEIETVIAHELGHYEKRHIVKNILIGTISSFLTLYLISYFYQISLAWFGFKSITEISALPLLTLWGMLIGVIFTPAFSMLSRKFEYEADELAVEKTGKPKAFITALEKLSEQNLSDTDPHPFVEWFFYSHPSLKNRISAIKNFNEDKVLKSLKIQN